MWEYPKSARHQAVINEMKVAAERSAVHAKAAEMKLERERDAKLALTEHEVNRVATLAKTKRLRAARLASAAQVQSKTLASGAKTTSDRRRSK
jgi:hypothetical protein